jgi:hypothetical protein
MRKYLERFWGWYEKRLRLHTGVAAGLFLLQLVHLYWLTTHVVALRTVGISYFTPPPFWEYVIILVDYTEIPALITTSLVYMNELRKGGSAKNVWFLFSINSQWLHIFWITDEFVLSQFVHGEALVAFPLWLAWTAILIDYLELPVIFDTCRKFFAGRFGKSIQKA